MPGDISPCYYGETVSHFVQQDLSGCAFVCLEALEKEKRGLISNLDYCKLKVKL
jgi:hypothetical protein